MEELSFYKFCLETYERTLTADEKSALKGKGTEDMDIDSTGDDSGLEESQVPVETKNKGGRRKSRSCSYQESHPRYGIKTRVLRQKGHRFMPAFIGGSEFGTFPSAVGTPQMHSAAMLAIFAPWRSATDLKSLYRKARSWESALDRFLSGTTQEIRNLVANTSLEKQSKDASAAAEDRERDNQDSLDAEEFLDRNHELNVHNDEGNIEDEDDPDLQQPKWPEARTPCQAAKNLASAAVEIGNQSGLFSAKVSSHQESRASQTTQITTETAQSWRGRFEAAKLDMPSTASEDPHSSPSTFPQPVVLTPGENDPGPSNYSSSATYNTKNRSEAYKCLNEDQKRAADIIIEHLKYSIAGRDPPQLLMKLMGEPGTGKSKVIEAVSEEFAQLGQSKALKKMAWMGVAGALIGGGTICREVGINPRAKGAKGKGKGKGPDGRSTGKSFRQCQACV